MNFALSVVRIAPAGGGVWEQFRAPVHARALVIVAVRMASVFQPVANAFTNRSWFPR